MSTYTTHADDTHPSLFDATAIGCTHPSLDLSPPGIDNEEIVMLGVVSLAATKVPAVSAITHDPCIPAVDATTHAAGKDTEVSA